MIAVGLRAYKGGALAIGVAVENGEPLLLFSDIVATSSPGDRLSFEPYAVAFEHSADRDAAEAAVAAGRDHQDRFAAANLGALADRVDAPIKAALLVNRAGWITDLLDYSLAFADHVPVAELLAVREALRRAFVTCAIDAVELDEKSLPEVAADKLGLSSEQIDVRLKALGTGIKPWRKEQKLAALAAWLTAAR